MKWLGGNGRSVIEENSIKTDILQEHIKTEKWVNVVMNI